MDEQKSPLLWIFVIIVALILGIGGGWWYGNKVGYTKGKADGKAEAQAQALKAATEAANPFKQAPANPLESLKLNPFK